MNNIDIKQIPNEIILLTFHISFKRDDYFCDWNKNGSIEMYDQLLQTIVNPQFATWYNEQTITTHKQFEEEINNLRAKFNNGEIDYKELGAQAKIARANKDELQAYVSHTSLFRSQFFAELESQIRDNLVTFNRGQALLFANENDHTNLMYCRQGQVYECSHNQKRVDIYYDETMKQKYDILLGKVESNLSDDDSDDDEWGGK